MEHRDGRDDLPQQAERDVDVEFELRGVCDFEDAREAGAVGAVADQGEAAAVEALDAARAPVIGVAEVGEPADALAQGKVESGRRGQSLVEAQAIDRFAILDRALADPEPIGEGGGRAAVVTFGD